MEANCRTTNVGSLVARIPRQHILRLGAALGEIAYVLDVPHRRTIFRNLRFIYPDMSWNRVRELSRQVFRHFGITFLEMLQMAFSSREDVLGRIRTAGEEHYLAAVQENRGVIFISAHLGNWEMALQFAACYFQAPVLTVAKHLPVAFLDRRLTRLRTRFGAKVLFKKNVLPDMVKAVRNGEVLTLLMDMGRDREGVDVTFLGRKATATPGAALVALRCDSPVIPGFCVREADGDLTVRFYPAISLKRTGNLRSDIQTNTQLMSDAVERAVRAHPGQWGWHQRKWKKHYPSLYPEFFARKARRKRRLSHTDA
jgi:KDO2-lipid IV(A) lauroyltransferase